MVKDTTEHKWVEWAEDSFPSARFGRDSRASFADYGEGWCHSFLGLYQFTTFLAYTRSSEDFLLIPGHLRSSLFIPGAVHYSHQWPGCGGRILGRYNAEERFLGRLREWRLGEHDPRLGDDSGRRVVSSRSVSGMSTTANCSSFRWGSVQFNPRIQTSSAWMGQYKTWP